jgi:ABC-2 type transport system ATP-binding protein
MEGRTVFLSTHNLAEAEYLCHRIAVIRTRILALDTPDSLRQRLFRRRVIVQLESVSPSMVEAVRSLAFVGGITQEGDRLLIDLVDTDKNRPELVKCIVDAGGRVLGVSEEQHSLEEVYLSLVKEDR